MPYDAINQLFIVGGCGWASTNSAAQTEASAVARRPAAGRCAVFVVPFSFGYFPDSHRGWASKRKVTYEILAADEARLLRYSY